ncbi:HpcH/HpaI aldolase family protein [Shumkonia mesophila]|uniref:HpcH/HpaI aldolase family protein n=1 Tax=Shumkonia mesophila TaxID=2838854 RepID=UPI0029351C03|nr:aldolase/citrate lyase family protein [Shumkonia mesophila]
MVYGLHLSFPSPALIEILSSQGLDFVYFDGEHGAFDLHDIENCCRAANLVGLTPIARVPDISSGMINRFLDRGVQGIIGPHIATPADAERLVQACYFAPLGQRSWGDSRGGEGYGIAITDMPRRRTEINEGISVGAMIEEKEALANLDAILKVPGIDYFNFGMQDLAQSLGHPGQDSHPDVKAFVDAVSTRIRATGRTIREDFMAYAWVRDVLHQGIRATITTNKAG